MWDIIILIRQFWHIHRTLFRHRSLKELGWSPPKWNLCTPAGGMKAPWPSPTQVYRTSERTFRSPSKHYGKITNDHSTQRHTRLVKQQYWSRHHFLLMFSYCINPLSLLTYFVDLCPIYFKNGHFAVRNSYLFASFFIFNKNSPKNSAIFNLLFTSVERKKAHVQMRVRDVCEI